MTGRRGPTDTKVLRRDVARTYLGGTLAWQRVLHSQGEPMDGMDDEALIEHWEARKSEIEQRQEARRARVRYLDRQSARSRMRRYYPIAKARKAHETARQELAARKPHPEQSPAPRRKQSGDWQDMSDPDTGYTL